MTLPAIFTEAVDFDADLYRNIHTVRPSQHLLDDLSDDPRDWQFGEAAASREVELNAIITRPFEYGVSLSADALGRPVTRFSESTRYGVWYGSIELETTVYETVYHWFKFLRSARLLMGDQEEIRADRRVFLVHCRALLIDLRNKVTLAPGLIDRHDYAFTHEVGRYVHSQQQNGLLTRSARCEGDNAAIFKPAVLSNPRHHLYLSYRWKPGSPQVRVQKTAGKTWLAVIPMIG